MGRVRSMFDFDNTFQKFKTHDGNSIDGLVGANRGGLPQKLDMAKSIKQMRRLPKEN